MPAEPSRLLRASLLPLMGPSTEAAPGSVVFYVTEGKKKAALSANAARPALSRLHWCASA